MADAADVVAEVLDPELPMLTLADLGVVREVAERDGTVHVTITPTWSGCPAMATIRADLRVALRRAGYEQVEVHTQLAPAWTTDDLSDRGRQRLAEHGIAPPRRSETLGTESVLVVMPQCPRCGSRQTRELSRFGATACTAVHVCGACGEPFDRFKELV